MSNLKQKVLAIFLAYGLASSAYATEIKKKPFINPNESLLFSLESKIIDSYGLTSKEDYKKNPSKGIHITLYYDQDDDRRYEHNNFYWICDKDLIKELYAVDSRLQGLAKYDVTNIVEILKKKVELELRK